MFGFDPAADHAALVSEARGRRVFPASPEYSLVLRKISGRIAHGGGVRIPADSGDYETLRGLDRGRRPVRPADRPETDGRPRGARERVLAPAGKQQLRVVAAYSDGREADVTALAKFLSNNDGLASVQPGGLVTAGEVPGEAAVMASFMNQMDLFRVAVPRTERIDPYPAVPENNFIDHLVFEKLRKLNIAPSDLAGDADYLRRVYLDVIGTLPTADETRRFLDDKRQDRRARLVDELLERPEYADYWSLQWSDLLRVDRQALGPKRAYAYYKWVARFGGVRRAVRPVRPRRGDGGGAAGRGRPRQLLQGRDQTRRRGRRLVAGVPGHAHRLRRVPPPPVRPLGHGRLLRHDGVLLRRGREADRPRRHGDGGGRRRDQEPAHRRGDLRPRAWAIRSPRRRRSRATAAPPWPTG